MSGRQGDLRREAYAATQWVAVVQAPFTNLSCAEFQARAATWMLIKQAAVANGAGKSPIYRESVNRLIADIESWGNNTVCRYIIYDYNGSRGVTVLMLNGFERPGHTTLRYALSDGSSKGIGKCLIEEAVNVSARGGNQGKVCLIAESDFLEKHYKGYGFVTVEPASLMNGAIMTLNPRDQGTTGKWFYNGKRWSFYPRGS